MSKIQDIKFIENPVILHNRERYIDVDIIVEKTMKSWQRSLYSFQWVHPDGRIKDREDLPEDERSFYDLVYEKLEKGRDIEKPVLGIGLLENVEIGSGRATFLILAARGLKTIPVHIPKSHQDDFQSFIS